MTNLLHFLPSIFPHFSGRFQLRFWGAIAVYVTAATANAGILTFDFVGSAISGVGRFAQATVDNTVSGFITIDTAAPNFSADRSPVNPTTAFDRFEARGEADDPFLPNFGVELSTSFGQDASFSLETTAEQDVVVLQLVDSSTSIERIAFGMSDKTNVDIAGNILSQSDHLFSLSLVDTASSLDLFAGASPDNTIATAAQILGNLDLSSNQTDQINFYQQRRIVEGPNGPFDMLDHQLNFSISSLTLRSSDPSPVPAPATLALLGLGLAGVGRRKRN
ncbi:MAG: PEP-CTERM sorting domain-containing protein [Pseudomonadota bacterium]